MPAAKSAAAGKPAARKPRVHGGDPEGEHRHDAPVPAFDILDLGAQ
jgi:hypothetical protein